MEQKGTSRRADNPIVTKKKNQKKKEAGNEKWPSPCVTEGRQRAAVECFALYTRVIAYRDNNRWRATSPPDTGAVCD